MENSICFVVFFESFPYLNVKLQEKNKSTLVLMSLAKIKQNASKSGLRIFDRMTLANHNDPEIKSKVKFLIYSLNKCYHRKKKNTRQSVITTCHTNTC